MRVIRDPTSGRGTWLELCLGLVGMSSMSVLSASATLPGWPDRAAPEARSVLAAGDTGFWLDHDGCSAVAREAHGVWLVQPGGISLSNGESSPRRSSDVGIGFIGGREDAGLHGEGPLAGVRTVVRGSEAA